MRAPQYYGSQFTKITLVDVKGTPVVTRQLLIEGNYLSARLHGTTVRAVVQGGFRAPQLYAASVEYVDPWGRAYEQDAIDLQVDASVLRADPAWAPREVLQQIINVLVQRTSLALLKSPAGHGNLRISVDAARSGGQQIALRFDDDRPTPTPEQMQHLFSSDDSEPGLTLAWAQDAAAGIGGQLSAEAAHPFDGLVLQLRLPKKLRDPTPRGIVAD